MGTVSLYKYYTKAHTILTHSPYKDIDKIGHSNFIFGVTKDQILHKQESNDIIFGNFVNGYARVSGFEYFGNGFKVEFSIDREHESVGNRCHDVFDFGIFVFESSSHSDGSFVVDHVFLDVYLQEFEHFGIGIGGGEFGAERVVEAEREGFGNGIEDKSYNFDNGNCFASNLQGVSTASSLWNDFSKYNNDKGGRQESDDASGLVRKKDG